MLNGDFYNGPKKFVSVTENKYILQILGIKPANINWKAVQRKHLAD